MTHRRLIFFIFMISVLGNGGALAQGTEFFLRDDGEFNKDDPVDQLLAGAPSLPIVDPINPPDLDLDGVPGLTIAKGPSADAIHFQEWVSVLQPELCFSGFGRVHLYTVLKGLADNESAAVNVFVIDRDPGVMGDDTLIAQSGLVLDPWSPTGTWDEKLFFFVPKTTEIDSATGHPIYRFTAGHELVVRVNVGGTLSSQDVLFTYDSTNFPAKIFFQSSDCNVVVASGEVLDDQGGVVRFPDLWRDGPVVLAFVRHFG